MRVEQIPIPAPLWQRGCGGAACHRGPNRFPAGNGIASGGQKGINAINAAGNITIEAGDIESYGRGVNAEVEGLTISIPAIPVILPNGYSRNIPGTGNVSVNVGDVTSIAGDGINATTGFGTVFVKAGDIQAENGFGVNATSGLGFGLLDLSDLDDVDVDALVSSALLSNGVHVEVGDVASKETGIMLRSRA